MQIPGFETIILFGIGLVALYFFGKILVLPGKWVLRLFINAILGAVCISLLNFFGSGIQIYVPLNPFNAFIVGVFGVPGVIFVVILRLILIG